MDDGQIPALVWGLASHRDDYEASSGYEPASWNQEIQHGVALKRQGDYGGSVSAYAGLMSRNRILYSGLLGTMYKSVVCSGYLREAVAVLLVLRRVLERDPVEAPPGVDLTSSYDYHLPQLIRAAESPHALTAYLAPLSGNAAYRFPRSYEVAVSEFRGFMANVDHEYDRLAAQPPTVSASPQKSGCYVATAVYGDYDHPSVVTLRRFRDQKLARSNTGRTFIRVYYTVSPKVAARLRNTNRVNRLVRRVLDVFVARVEGLGLSPDQPS